jgi:O-methyltransferase
MSDADPVPPLEELLRPPFGEDAAQRLFTCFPDFHTLAPFFDFVVRRVLARDHRSVFWGDRMLTLDKHAGFLRDPAFAAAWEEVRGAHPYDQYDAQQSIAWRLHTLVWAARQAMSLGKGDFVECGVFQGDMSYVVFHAAGLAGCGRRMLLFDSFDGLDPAQVAEGEYALMPGYIEMANSYYQKPGLYESVLTRFAPYPEVSVHRGYLPGNLAGETPEAIAWLHIDLNSANAEVATLEVLFERVMPGGLIILDDYGWAGYAMQKSAEDAFFAKLGYQVLELPTGQGLVVKRL